MIRLRLARRATCVVFALLALYFVAMSFNLMQIPTRGNVAKLDDFFLGGLRLWEKKMRQETGGNSKYRGLSADRQNSSRGQLSSESEDFRKVRILCWVMTSPTSLRNRAIHVKQTWGPRCDVTLYMSSKPDPSFPAVALNVSEGRANLWRKTKLAFKYVYDHHFQDADWFMKADDDTYVIVENLRYFLRDKNSSAPLYYGHNFRHFAKQGYMSGGGGYILSKEALRRFAAQTPKPHKCESYYSAEDVGMGFCLEALGVVAGDSRDSLNRSRFLPLSLSDFVNRRLPKWYYNYKKYDIAKGPGCCSDYLISCHYVAPNVMHLLDFVIYHLRSATNNDERHMYKIGNNRTQPI